MEKETVADSVTDSEHLGAGELQQEPLLIRLTSQAPWWVVSVLFHSLLIVLAYMFSIAIGIDSNEEAVVNVSVITKPYDNAVESAAKKPEVSNADVLSSKDFAATDVNSKVLAMYETTPEMLLKAEFGDHTETINLLLPDTHGARGVEDAHMFHSATGSDEAAGGGGDRGNTLETVIGSGSMRSPGAHGGWGGGDGGGHGPDKGKWGGSYGHRGDAGRRIMIARFDGRGTENPVKYALRWLAYHQETDGHWDAKKHASGEKTDTAITGLALLAFLGAGNSEKVGEYKDNVVRAIAWLKGKQAANGLIWDTTDAGGHRGEGYPGAIATLAMCEAAGMGSDKSTHESAQRAVDYFCNRHQAGEGSDKLGWRYHPKMEGDTSVSGWIIMALKSAKVAGLHVDPASFDGAIKYLDSVEHKGTGGDVGYAPASTYWYTVKEPHDAHRLTAIGCLCRQFLGWKKEDLQASVDGFVSKGGVPAWGGNGGNVDLYYWYYGSLSVFQQIDKDGPGLTLWNKWNNGLKAALVPNQRKDGDESGSWDPVGAYSGEWGRAGETAMGCLCLEVYYRFALLGEK